MKSFLYVIVDQIPILLDGDAVYEIQVLTREMLEHDIASDHYSWRGQLILMVDTGELLGRARGVTKMNIVGVVYAASSKSPPMLFLVDEVVKIFKLGHEDFTKLPHLPTKVGQFFDQVFHDKQKERHAYRLRHPLPGDVLDNLYYKTEESLTD